MGFSSALQLHILNADSQSPHSLLQELTLKDSSKLVAFASWFAQVASVDTRFARPFLSISEPIRS